ncbi:uncharacterized protein CXQ87_002903 [Candidozyma duobushaemuli]|uniref:Uncharacterized protein n=2 Tax=Candidozyma TaxID=3303203 RepID=A0ABX8I4W8_9ASCO|nr:uncharacterized protein CXQ87_002903 [[Candida] duobushaemulonis]PVH15071.1 hypothetical protein CXQ87_002903 [[Candida] duobushaemulonis]QWU88335.1 hypothetical protein CA3LBN_002643 [[Candida] haemuloni]
MTRPLQSEPFGEQLEKLRTLHNKRSQSKQYALAAVAAAAAVKQNQALYGYNSGNNQARVERSENGQPRRLPLMYSNVDQMSASMAASHGAYRENVDDQQNMSRNWNRQENSRYVPGQNWHGGVTGETGTISGLQSLEGHGYPGMDGHPTQGGGYYGSQGPQGQMFHGTSFPDLHGNCNEMGGSQGLGHQSLTGNHQSSNWNSNSQSVNGYGGVSQVKPSANMFSANMFNMAPSSSDSSSVLGSSRSNVSNPSLTSQSPSHSLFSRASPSHDSDSQESINDTEPLTKPGMDSWNQNLEGNLEGSLLRSIWTSPQAQPATAISLGKW